MKEFVYCIFLYREGQCCGFVLPSMRIRIRIILCADQNYPLCGSELSSMYTKDQETMQRRLFPLLFCLDKKNRLQLQSYYQEWPKQAQGTTGNRTKKKCIRRLAPCFPVWLINFLFHFSTNFSTSRKFAIDMTGFFIYFIQDSCETGYCLQCKILIKVPV